MFHNNSLSGDDHDQVSYDANQKSGMMSKTLFVTRQPATTHTLQHFKFDD